MFKLLLWSVCCVALGIAMASVHIGRETPWMMLQKAVATHTSPAKINKAKSAVGEAVQGVKSAMSRETMPQETHSQADRDAVQQLVAQRR